MPHRVAASLAEHLPVRIVALPLRGLEAELSIVWHPRTASDPALAHLRDVIAATLRDPPRRRRRSE